MSDEATKAIERATIHSWSHTITDLANAKEVLENIEIGNMAVVSVNVLPDPNNADKHLVHIFARSNTSSLVMPPREFEVLKSGDFIPSCGCDSDGGAIASARLGPCSKCHRTVTWTHRPFGSREP